MKRTMCVLAFGFLPLSFGQTAPAQVVDIFYNGSFEVQDPILPWQLIDHSLLGADAICDSTCASGFFASDGDYYVLIAGGTFSGDTTGVVRSGSVFVPEGATTFEFDWATLGSGPNGDPCAGSDDGLSLLIDGVAVWSNLDTGPCVNVIPYQTIVIDLSAAGVELGTWHIFEFRGTATGIPPSVDLSNVYLDNVRLFAPPDADFDGIPDDVDNCLLVPNAIQCDGDGDGFGNHCDSDFNDDCIVNAQDLGILRSVFFTQDPEADANCDGAPIQGLDLGIFKANFFSVPGPSGLVDQCVPVGGTAGSKESGRR